MQNNYSSVVLLLGFSISSTFLFFEIFCPLRTMWTPVVKPSIRSRPFYSRWSTFWDISCFDCVGLSYIAAISWWGESGAEPFSPLVIHLQASVSLRCVYLAAAVWPWHLLLATAAAFRLTATSGTSAPYQTFPSCLYAIITWHFKSRTEIIEPQRYMYM